MSDEQKIVQLTKYYKQKAKSKEGYEYDDQGNLVERSGGQVTQTIVLPTYRSLTSAERLELEQKRKDAIELASKEFSDARMALHEEYQQAEPSDYQIYLLNQEVMRADLNLQEARFPVHFIKKDDSVSIRQLDFDQPNEIRKYPYKVAMLQTSPFVLQDQYVRIGEPGAKSFVSIAEAKRSLVGAAIVFDNVNPDSEGYGFLSLNWPVEIDIEGTMYHSARQAIFGELAKSFGDEAHRQAIMIAEKPEDIHYTVDDVPGDVDANKRKWDTTIRELIETVNLYKFLQYPELGGRLLETQDAKLGAYEPDDNLFGTGIPLNHQKAKNPIYWTGENLQGKALMVIRDILRQQMEEEQAKVVVPPKKSVKKSVKKETSVAAPSVPAPSVAPSAAPLVAPSAAPSTSSVARRPRKTVKIVENNLNALLL